VKDNVDNFLHSLGNSPEDNETPSGAAQLLRQYADRIESGERVPGFILVGLDLSDGKLDLSLCSNLRYSKILVALARANHHVNRLVDGYDE
jgi:hypothetical protein